MPEPLPSHPVEILDVTIRDGSYTIDFQFTAADIRFLCKTLEEVGFRYIEVGHGFGLNAAAAKGASAGTDDEYLAAAAESLHQAAFGTFFIPGIGRKEDLRRARENFGMHFVRIGDEPDRIETSAVEYIEYAKELGYEVMANFMKTYAVTPRELAAKAKFLRAHGCDAIYIVDSAGGMLPGEVAAYTRAVAEACNARIGFHGHNNLELASANTIAAYENGCTLLDCSIGGLGRSSGNTRSEMLIPRAVADGREVGLRSAGHHARAGHVHRHHPAAQVGLVGQHRQRLCTRAFGYDEALRGDGRQARRGRERTAFGLRPGAAGSGRCEGSRAAGGHVGGHAFALARPAPRKTTSSCRSARNRPKRGTSSAVSWRWRSCWPP